MEKSQTPGAKGVKSQAMEDDDTVHISKSPAFVLYTDSELIHAAKVNTMSKELLNHLVRNMISNMKSACQKLPIKRAL